MDDCVEEDFLIFAQLIEKHQVKATFFLPLNYVKENSAMWYSKLHFLAESGKLVKFLNKKYDLGINSNIRPFIKAVESWIYGLKLQTSEAEDYVERLSIQNGIDLSFIPYGKRVISEHVVRQYASSDRIDFASHTFSHPFLYLCSEVELKEEIIDSGRNIEAITGKYSHSFCYPYGSLSIIGNFAPRIVKEKYDYGVTLEGGVIGINDNPYQLKRIGIYPCDSKSAMISKICHYQNISMLGRILGN